MQLFRLLCFVTMALRVTLRFVANLLNFGAFARHGGLYRVRSVDPFTG